MKVPLYWVTLGFLAFAFANPVGYLLTSAGVYQAAILGGQVSLLGGLVLAFDAVWVARTGAVPALRLLGAGTVWSMGLASRISVAPAIACFIVITAFATGRATQRRFMPVLRDMMLMGGPVVAGSLALLTYNKLRFDSWFDFGTSKQLTTFQVLHFSADYSYANLYSYFLRPAELSCKFPFLIQWVDHGIQPLPSWVVSREGYYVQEPLVGDILAVPCILLAPLVLVIAGHKVLRFLRDEGPAARDQRRTYLWCAASFAALGTAPGLAVMGINTATMRYLADFNCGLVLLAILGALSLRSTLLAGRKARVFVKPLSFVYSGTAVATVMIGLLLGYQGYLNHFDRYNSKLYGKMVKSLSLCE